MRFFLTILFFTSFLAVSAQEKFLTKTGDIVFFSETIVEDIKAENNKVLSIIDTSNGDMGISMLMDQFEFPKKLMQEHFNENYIESEKYPKSTFKGTITDFLKIPENVATKTQVKGTMTIHGVSREVVIPSTITKKEGEIVMDGKFIIKLEDYKIKIPKIVIKNIAEEIEVTYKLNHLPYN